MCHLPEAVVSPLAHEHCLEFCHIGHQLRERSAIGLLPRRYSALLTDLVMRLLLLIVRKLCRLRLLDIALEERCD